MSPRFLALWLLLVAASLHLGVTVPARRQTDRLRQTVGRLSQARREARARMAESERRSLARQRALAVLEEATAASGEPVTRLRAAILSPLEGRPLRRVALSVRAQSAPIEASMHLALSGGFEQVVFVSGELAGPARGLVLQRVVFTPDPPGVRLEMDARRLDLSR